jgi:CheY-like chemotaxis protein
MDGARGKRILIVEDEPILAIALQDMLESFGYEVVGPAFRVAPALALAAGAAIDGAILDVNMGEGDSYGIARRLDGRNIPYLFATGYGRDGLDPGHEAALVLQKPYREKEVEAALGRLFETSPTAPRL